MEKKSKAEILEEIRRLQELVISDEDIEIEDDDDFAFIEDNDERFNNITRLPRNNQHPIFELLALKKDKQYLKKADIGKYVEKIDYPNDPTRTHLSIKTDKKNGSVLPSFLRKGKGSIQMNDDRSISISKFSGIVYIYFTFGISADIREINKYIMVNNLNPIQIKSRVETFISKYIESINSNNLVTEFDFAYFYGINQNNKYTDTQRFMLSPLIPDSGYNTTGKQIAISGRIFKDIPSNIDQDDIFTMQLEAIAFNKLPYNVECNNHIIDTNCVSFVLDKYCHSFEQNDRNKRYDEAIKMANVIQSWTVASFISFCEIYGINVKVYYFNGKLLHKSEMKNKIRALICIVSNKHIYMMNKKEITAIKQIFSSIKDKNEITNIEYIEGDLIQDIKKKNIIPSEYNIIYKADKVDDNKTKLYINNYTSNNTLYTDDIKKVQSYKIFKQIFDKMNKPIPLSSKYSDVTPLIHLGNINNLWSTNTLFMNDCISLFNYQRAVSDEDKQKYKYMTKIDKNKAHMFSLYSLDFVPVIDSTCHTLKYDKQPIDNYNFYHVIRTDKTKSIKCYKNGWQSGFIINALKEQNVIIDSYIVPVLKPNPYKQLISECTKYDLSSVKLAINKFIGYIQNNSKLAVECMVPQFMTNNMKEVNSFCATDNAYGFEVIEDRLYSIYKKIETKECMITKNMLPLAIMINNLTTIAILDKVKDLNNIKDKIKIINIKVDSITIMHNGQTDIEPYVWNCDLINGWKYEDIKTDYTNKNDIEYDNHPHTFKLKQNLSSLDDYKTGNLYISSYAGGGKTYALINKIIDKLKGKTLITSTQYSALTDFYKLKNENPDKYEHIDIYVIQKLECTPKLYNNISSYNNIIIDEGGLMTGVQLDNFIMKCNTMQNIIITGDPKQLAAICNNERTHYILMNGLINYYFDNEYHLTNNMRNHYTKKNYDDMFNNKFKLTSYERKKINVISENNICFFNKTVDKINKQVVDKMDTVLYNDIKVCKGMKIYTIENFKDIELFKNCPLVIESFNNESIKLNTEYGVTYEIPKELFISKNFQHGYAISLYKVQGRSIPYDNISFHDFNYIKSEGRMLYVCLSRIKNK
jgi:hypothetical protein